MNKKGVPLEQLILAIMAIVVVISVIFFSPQLLKLLAPFKADFEDLSLSEKSKLEANFNQLIENIKKCKDVDDYECLCSGFPDFPSTFRQECKLEIEQKGNNVDISLLFNEKKALDASVEDVNLLAMGYSLDGWIEIASLKKLKKKTLDFKMIELREEYYPFFHLKVTILKGRLPAVTDKIYKGRDKVGFIVSPVATSAGVEEQKSATAKLPKCLPKRLDAIKGFDKVVDALKEGKEQELTIELPQDYRIWIYNNKSIALQYKKEEKSELAERHGETLQEKFVYVLFTFDIKCKEPEKGEFLLDGDKIKIKKTAKAACLEKV